MQPQRTGFAEQLMLTILIGLTIFSAIMLVVELIVPHPIQFAGIVIDRLSTAITLLVAGVGTVCYRFSLRYLDGEPGQIYFLRWLFFTVCMAYLLLISVNLLLLFAAWALTSMGLHRLLLFYQDREQAFRPARKKFLISRLGDVALLSAIAWIWIEWNTLNLLTFAERLDDPNVWVGSPLMVALLVVTAALTKSAQFPFHSWLPETMESPTPVSALMHAGIINAGGVLLLRFAPLLVFVPSALLLLVLVGTLTLTLGLLAMWSQTNVKRTLAWSTVSQMGFMMVQIGLAAFPAALLHLIGHGFYKAWSFLRTGDLPQAAPSSARLEPGFAVGLLVVGALTAVPAIFIASFLTGFDPLHSPGELALTAIVALAMGQIWTAFFRTRSAGSDDIAVRAGGALLTTFIATFGAFALYKGATLFFTPVVGTLPIVDGPLAWVAAVIPVLVLIGLSVVHALLPTLGRTPAGRAFFVQSLHGFYFGAIADRLVDQIWRRIPGKTAPATPPKTSASAGS